MMTISACACAMSAGGGGGFVSAMPDSVSSNFRCLLDNRDEIKPDDTFMNHDSCWNDDAANPLFA